MESSHPLQAGFGIKGQNLSSLLPHNLLYGQFLLKLSQERKEGTFVVWLYNEAEEAELAVPA